MIVKYHKHTARVSHPKTDADWPALRQACLNENTIIIGPTISSDMWLPKEINFTQSDITSLYTLYTTFVPCFIYIPLNYISLSSCNYNLIVLVVVVSVVGLSKTPDLIVKRLELAKCCPSYFKDDFPRYSAGLMAWRRWLNATSFCRRKVVVAAKEKSDSQT